MASLVRMCASRLLNRRVVQSAVNTVQQKYLVPSMLLRCINYTSKPQAISKPTRTYTTQPDQTVEEKPVLQAGDYQPALTVKKNSKFKITTSDSDFASLSKKRHYVDKTLLVHEVLNDDEAILITAPRRWGKTVMVSTLEYFLQIQVDEEGNPIAGSEWAKPDVVLTETDNYKLFENLNVGKQLDTMKHLGKYPVIRLNLYGEAESSEAALGICQTAIHNSYRQHEYLIKSKKLQSADHELVAKWCDPKKYESMSWMQVHSAINKLSKILYEYFGEKNKCIILIDEYDSIIMKYLSAESFDSEKFEDIRENISSMLVSSVKSNNYMARAFLTGITYVTGLWSNLNHLEKYRFLGDHQYGSLYGLTQEEVDMLLEKAVLSGMKEQVRSYYHGYTSLSGHSIYSVWSIMKYLKNRKFEKFWCTTGSIWLLEKSFFNLSLRKKMTEMMEGNAVPVEVCNEYSLEDILDMREFVKNPNNHPKNVENELFSMFLDQGCLTYAGATDKLTVPNMELVEYLRSPLEEYFQSNLSQHQEERDELTAAFNEIFKYLYSKDKLPSVLGEFLNKMTKLLTLVCPIEEDVNENTVRMVFCEAVKACSVYNVEQLIGRNRTDFCGLIKNCGGKIGLLVEFKVCTTEESTKNAESAVKAKAQIIKSKYIDVFGNAKALETPPEIFVMALSYSKSSSEWHLLHTLFTPGNSSDKSATLQKNKWFEIVYPPKQNP